MNDNKYDEYSLKRYNSSKVIAGYKAFNSNFTTRYKSLMEKGHFYTTDSNIKFGMSGYHFCKRMEDTLRYFDGFKPIQIAKVLGMGEIVEYYDHYNGYYDMYACSKIYIESFLTKEEIWQYVLTLVKEAEYGSLRLFRIIQGYKLNEEQKRYILERLKNKNSYDYYEKAIEYY